MQREGRDPEIARLQKELVATRDRERDLADFIENASLPLHWLDGHGRILWANEAELELLGYPREEYLGHHISEFHADPPVVEDVLHRLAEKESIQDYEARLRRKDGALCHVLISSNVRWRGGEFIHTRCCTRDITSQKRYEQRLSTQYGAGRILAGATSLEAAVAELLQLVCECLEWRAGLYWTYSEEEGLLRCEASWERARGEGSTFVSRCSHFTFAPGVRLPGRVWRSQAPVSVVDMEKDSDLLRRRLVAEHSLRSAFAFPVMLAGRVFGALEFFSEVFQEAG